MKKRSTRNGTNFFGKIKTEHSIVRGLYDILQQLAAIKEIKSIIPGQIRRRGSSSKAVFNITIPTATGWKAIGKVKGSTQDFFIVTDEPDIVNDQIKSKFR